MSGHARPDRRPSTRRSTTGASGCAAAGSSRPRRYTVKLEGAEQVGYQSIVIGSVRDPFIIRQIDDWAERLKERIKRAGGRWSYGDTTDGGDYVFNVRIYGKDGTMGPLEPVKEIRSHELCLVFEVTAPTQEIATTIVAMARHQAPASADPGMERPDHRRRLPLQPGLSGPRGGLPLQRQPRRRAGRSVRDVPHGMLDHRREEKAAT